MKKNLTMVVAIAACGIAVTTTSCKKEGCTDPTALNYNEDIKDKNDDGSCIYAYEPVDTVYVSSNITADQTWVTGKTYILQSRVAVTSGATLTIQPGVVVKGEAGTGANATALIVARGGMINAVGTASSPIIFTSVADHIVPGQIASPNLSTDLDGLWGGVIVLGNAKISVASGTEAQIEGIPASDSNGKYGGTNDADNSGTIQYVSIRHGGANIGDGNEINGLTLGGVGSGTTIDHIEIISNQDDGIEFFGGAVNVSHVVVLNTGDDGLDTDQGYSGTISNFIIINAGDAAMELDGPEGSDLGNGNHTFTNGGIQIGRGSELCDTDANTNVNMNNIFWFDFGSGSVFTELPTTSVAAPVFASFQADIPSGDAITDYFLLGSDAAVTNVAVGSQTVGPDKSAFNTWSWTAIHADAYLADF
ncbi:MAG: right-handed parallel beta-helix repeat-containing protein [Crocinitomicaceae bacterium]|nr:right-handed parallel beta-helix repeat-containing protein [Crocinitomicaceae bacterium]